MQSASMDIRVSLLIKPIYAPIETTHLSLFIYIQNIFSFRVKVVIVFQENLPNFASEVSFAILSYCKKTGEATSVIVRNSCIQQWLDVWCVASYINAFTKQVLQHLSTEEFHFNTRLLSRWGKESCISTDVLIGNIYWHNLAQRSGGEFLYSRSLLKCWFRQVPNLGSPDLHRNGTATTHTSPRDNV